MSDTHTAAPPQPVEGDLRLISALVYGLFLFSLCNGITALVAVIIAYIKRGDARGTPYESHFSNAITVFWVTAVFMVLFIAMLIAGLAGVLSFFGPAFWHWHSDSWNGGVQHWPNVQHGEWNGPTPFVPPHDWWPLLALLPVAHLAFIGFGVWWFYRVLRGLIRTLDGKPY